MFGKKKNDIEIIETLRILNKKINDIDVIIGEIKYDTNIITSKLLINKIEDYNQGVVNGIK